MCVDYFIICRNFIASMTARTDLTWTDGNDAENDDWFRLCGTNRPKCAECPSINKILFHIVINYAVFWSKVMSELTMVGFFFREGVRKGYFVIWGLEGVSRRIIGILIRNWFVIKMFKGCRPPPPSDLRMTSFRFFSWGFFLHNIHIYLKIY